MKRPTQRHPGYWAFLIHRVSGIGLAVFLPVHFLVLGLALRKHNALDGFLRWTEAPVVKLVEMLLIVLLTAHLTGGLRILAVEFLPWSDRQQSMITAALGTAILAGLLFLLNSN